MGNSTSFKPGQGGRKKGGQNKFTKTVKETVLAVFNDQQEDPQANLTAWAKAETTEFYKIAAKLIPTEITANVAATVTWNETKTYEAKHQTDHST